MTGIRKDAAVAMACIHRLMVQPLNARRRAPVARQASACQAGRSSTLDREVSHQTLHTSRKSQCGAEPVPGAVTKPFLLDGHAAA